MTPTGAPGSGTSLQRASSGRPGGAGPRTSGLTVQFGSTDPRGSCPPLSRAFAWSDSELAPPSVTSPGVASRQLWHDENGSEAGLITIAPGARLEYRNAPPT